MFRSFNKTIYNSKRLLQHRNIAMGAIYNQLRSSSIKPMQYVMHRPEPYSCFLFPCEDNTGLESIINSNLTNDDKILVISNGIYADRIYKISKKLEKNASMLRFSNNLDIDVEDVKDIFDNHPEFTHASITHHETSTGKINDIKQISSLCTNYGKKLIIDSIYLK